MVIACNTAHLLLPQIEEYIGHRLVSLIDVTVERVHDLGLGTIGLLASPTTVRTKLYHMKLEERHLRIIEPTASQLDLIEACIRSVIAGKDPRIIKPGLQQVVRDMQARGAQGVVLGCTELSLIFSDDDDTALIDPFELITSNLLGDRNDR